jgi:cysteine desulfurase
MRLSAPQTDIVYLDFAASTPVDPRVIESFLAASLRYVGNPDSWEHSFGSQAARVVSEAGKELADVLGVPAHTVTFTSGATEANNLAFAGVAAKLRASGRTHVLISALEHASVYAAAQRWLGEAGFEIEVIPASRSGVISLEDVRARVRGTTGLISVMAVNNEIGSVQPIAEVSRIAAECGALFHCDASQAVGRIDLAALKGYPDFLVVSGHKAYCPAGIGALLVGAAVGKLSPLLVGGGQQRGVRPGTIPTALVVALREAVSIALRERDADWQHATECFVAFEQVLRSYAVPFKVQADRTLCVPHIVHISFAGIDVSELLGLVPTVCFSRGAACSSAKGELSKTLLALGIEESEIRSSARFSFGRPLKVREVERAAAELARGYWALRGMPLPESIERCSSSFDLLVKGSCSEKSVVSVRGDEA